MMRRMVRELRFVTKRIVKRERSGVAGFITIPQGPLLSSGDLSEGRVASASRSDRCGVPPRRRIRLTSPFPRNPSSNDRFRSPRKETCLSASGILGGRGRVDGTPSMRVRRRKADGSAGVRSAVSVRASSLVSHHQNLTVRTTPIRRSFGSPVRSLGRPQESRVSSTVPIEPEDEERQRRAAHRRICRAVSVVCLGSSAIGILGKSLGIPTDALIPLGAIGIPYAVAWGWAVWRGDSPSPPPPT